jgi:hypothetical protein
VGFVPTGINDIRALKLYIAPNPATQQVTISTVEEISELHIYDILGQEVIHTTPTHKHVETIDVSSLVAGMYIVQVSSPSGKGTARLVINK